MKEQHTCAESVTADVTCKTEDTANKTTEEQQTSTKKLQASDTPPTTALNGVNDTPQTPPTPPPTHEFENDDVETPPSPNSQMSSTPLTPPTPESEQPFVRNVNNRKRRQPQDVMTTNDDFRERDTPQNNGKEGYALQRQSTTLAPTTTTTKTPSVGVSSLHNKKSSTAASTATSVSSSITFTSNKARKRKIMNNKTKSFNSSSATTPKQPIQTAKKKKKSNQQLFLDFGQSSFGKRTVCSICGMMRVHGVTEDDIQHAKICKDYKEGVTCLGWKNERKVEEFGGGSSRQNDRILEVRGEDALQHRKKVLEVKRIVDGELGFAISGRQGDGGDDVLEVENDSLNGLTSYLYVSNKRIVGLLMVKRIQRAYQVVLPKGTAGTNGRETNDESSTSFSISRSLKPSRALLGIHQIWVHTSHRNKGIASKLVTAARDHLIFGMMVPLELVAFSSPTMEGLKFAKSYLGVERPLVYDIS